MFGPSVRYLCLFVGLFSLCGCVCAKRDGPVASSRPRWTADVPILLYHHIERLPPNANRAQRRWTLTPEKFEAQMDWVAKEGFHPVTTQQLIAHLKHGDALPPKPIVLTFDDGWKDHYSTVLPVLQKHNFTATFFIITGSIGSSAYMTWDQVQALAEAGMDIQSHTVTHPRLSTLPLARLRREVFDSKRILEEKLDKPVTILAYPFGKYDEDVIAMVQEARMEGAVAVGGLNAGYLFRRDQSYTLERYAVEGEENFEEVARLKGLVSR